MPHRSLNKWGGKNSHLNPEQALEDPGSPPLPATMEFSSESMEDSGTLGSLLGILWVDLTE